MDVVAVIHHSLSQLPSDNIYELLNIYHIEIQYEPLLITHKRESMILSYRGQTIIFLKPTTNTQYIQFLLWHEFGHYILHRKPNMRMNYYQSTRWMETEQQANIFAVLGVLRNTDLVGKDPVQVAVADGIPQPIVEDVFRILAERQHQCQHALE